MYPVEDSGTLNKLFNSNNQVNFETEVKNSGYNMSIVVRWCRIWKINIFSYRSETEWLQNTKLCFKLKLLSILIINFWIRIFFEIPLYKNTQSIVLGGVVALLKRSYQYDYLPPRFQYFTPGANACD